MRTYTIEIDEYTKDLHIGVHGENLVSTVLFDLSEWKSLFGDGIVHILHKRPKDQYPYIITPTIENNMAVWTLSEVDLAQSGSGECIYEYIVNDETKVKSRIYATHIKRDLGDGVPTPSPWDNWLETLLKLQDKAEQAVIKASEFADKAEEASKHYPIINNENNHWMLWGVVEEEYIDTGINANGIYIGENPPEDATIWIDTNGEESKIDYEDDLKNKPITFYNKEPVTIIQNEITVPMNNGYGEVPIDDFPIDDYFDILRGDTYCTVDIGGTSYTLPIIYLEYYGDFDYVKVPYALGFNQYEGVHMEFYDNGTTGNISIANLVIHYPNKYGIVSDKYKKFFGYNNELNSFTEGYGNTAESHNSHAEGEDTIARGGTSHAEGNGTIASGEISHAEGNLTEAAGNASHAEGMLTKALGYYSHSEGYTTISQNNNAHAEGYKTTSSGNGAHSEGGETIAQGNYSHAEGYQTQATQQMAHAEGWQTTASGMQSHTEGYMSTAESRMAHAEGWQTTASGDAAHSEGYLTVASGGCSHAEGQETKSAGTRAHAEGNKTEASGGASHAEGQRTIASGGISHAEGNYTKAEARASHAEGNYTTASAENQHVQGKYNIADTTSAHIVGNGTAETNRSNAHTLDFNGNAWYAGDVYVHSTSGKNKDDGSKKLLTEDDIKTILLNLSLTEEEQNTIQEKLGILSTEGVLFG